MEQFTNSQIHEAIGNIVSQFDLYQCQDCAKTVLQWLADNHIEGELLQLRTRMMKTISSAIAWAMNKQLPPMANTTA